MEEWIISRRRPDYQGVALRWENAWAFGPHVVRPSTWIWSASHRWLARSACPEGASVRPAKGTALVAKTPTTLPFFHHSVFRSWHVRAEGPSVRPAKGTALETRQPSIGDVCEGQRPVNSPSEGGVPAQRVGPGKPTNLVLKQANPGSHLGCTFA